MKSGNLYDQSTTRAIRQATMESILRSEMPNPRREYSGFIQVPKHTFPRGQPHQTGSPAKKTSTRHGRGRPYRLPEWSQTPPKRRVVPKEDWDALDRNARLDRYHSSKNALPTHPSQRGNAKSRHQPAARNSYTARSNLPDPRGRPKFADPPVQPGNGYASSRPQKQPRDYTTVRGAPSMHSLYPDIVEPDYAARAAKVREKLQGYSQAEIELRYGTVARQGSSRRYIGELDSNRKHGRVRAGSFSRKLKEILGQQ